MIKKSARGFTLIELLLVVGIIALLSISVFVALNPAQRLKDTKDSRRATDVDNILSAIHTYIVDQKGALPTGLTAGMAEKQLGTGNAATCSPVATGGCGVAASTACVDLSTPLAAYLKSIPVDPGSTILAFTPDATRTAYSVAVDTNGIVTVRACGTEGTTNISASR